MVAGMNSADPTRPGAAVLAEAAAALLAGSAARLVVPFRRLAAALARHGSLTPATPTEVETVRRAIDAWTRRLPVRPKCFARGLAAFAMLKRRGRAARLYYGAATIDGTLKAHVWVRSGDRDVVGCEIADKYALLAVFPELPAADYVSKG
jgi:hypothetical protein